MRRKNLFRWQISTTIWNKNNSFLSRFCYLIYFFFVAFKRNSALFIFTEKFADIKAIKFIKHSRNSQELIHYNEKTFHPTSILRPSLKKVSTHEKKRSNFLRGKKRYIEMNSHQRGRFVMKLHHTDGKCFIRLFANNNNNYTLQAY